VADQISLNPVDMTKRYQQPGMEGGAMELSFLQCFEHN
jgi:hypothetical protein